MWVNEPSPWRCTNATVDAAYLLAVAVPIGRESVTLPSLAHTMRSTTPVGSCFTCPTSRLIFDAPWAEGEANEIIRVDLHRRGRPVRLVELDTFRSACAGPARLAFGGAGAQQVFMRACCRGAAKVHERRARFPCVATRLHGIDRRSAPSDGRAEDPHTRMRIGPWCRRWRRP
jgi:hypothetical protein